MPYQILASGYRPNFSLLSFEPESAKLKLVADSPAPDSASWVEEAVKQSGPGKVIYSCSEGEKEGLAVSLKLDGDKVEVTSSRKTRGAPAHSEYEYTSPGGWREIENPKRSLTI